jgi:outer membrane protein assembly factor BamB
MWRIMACAAVAALGCSGNDDCELRLVIPPSTATASGTLQQAIVYHSSAPWVVAPRADGSVMCVTCSTAVTLDTAVREVGRLDIADPRRVVVAPDDAIYVVAPGSTSDAAKLVALSPAGEPRWTASIFSDGSQGITEVFATSDGLYAIGPTPTPALVRFAPATGEPHTLATGQAPIGAGPRGVFTVEAHSARALTLRLLDPTGTVVWSHAMTSEFATPDIGNAVATPDGGVIVFGSASSSLELADRTLPILGPRSFVVGFDAAGASQFAFTTEARITALALTTHGELLIGTVTGGGFAEPEAESYLHVATAAGVSRTLAITGPAHQTIHALAAAPDGLAWVQLTSGPDDNSPTPAMTISDHTFTEQGTYLFKLVP